MDNCAPVTTAATFDQENNQLLLNAIKSKFAAKTASEAASFSPPKFTIPTLKTLEVGGNAKVSTVASSTNKQDNGQNQLNTYLLNQLQNKQKCQDTSQRIGFEVPLLQIGNEVAKCPRFEIPLLNSTQSAISSSSGVSSLTTAIKQLKVQEDAKTLNCIDHHPAPSSPSSTIDLTSALSSKSFAHPGTPPTRDLKLKQKQLTTTEHFVIPFIDCDRLDNATSRQRNLVPENEYCLLDISQLTFKPSYKQQLSPVGKFFHLVQKRYTPIPKKPITPAPYQIKVKYDIKTFRFDTKSPDDKVSESMSKYSRR